MQGQSIEHLDVPPASLRGNISSVMSDISGDIKSVHPEERRAGSWYVSDMLKKLHQPPQFVDILLVFVYPRSLLCDPGVDL